MRKLKRYPSLTSAVGRIKVLYRAANASDVKAGLEWYSAAHQFAERLANETQIPIGVVCHVIAVLSPVCLWDRNMTDAENVCTEFMRTGQVVETQVSTYGPNRAKAERILDAWSTGEDWDGILSGPKVTAFATNLMNPENGNTVTLDTHALSVAMGVHHTNRSLQSLPRPAIMERYRVAYRTAARQLGLRSNQVQAVTWLAWRAQQYVAHTSTLRLRGEEI